MNSKKIAKNIITYFRAKLNKIAIGKNCDIGFNDKIVNRGAIICGDNIIIRPSTGIYTHIKNSKIYIGDNTEIGRDSTISSFNEIVFGNYVLTGPHVFISDNNHEYDNPMIPISKQGVRCLPGDRVYIGDGTWIGTNVVIVGNVKIGKHCVIGANSVVTKDIPDYCIVAGVPCKIIKRYDFETNKWVRI